jgi:transposase InsO family protein
MQGCPDGQFKFILNYQDHFTKFCILRPLKTKTAAEVANNLLDIFTIFGAPALLQSDNGREFVVEVIEELALIWKDLKILHEKARHPQSQGSVERCNQDAKQLLGMSWQHKLFVISCLLLRNMDSRKQPH